MKRLFAACLVFAALARSVSALTIVLDYTYDSTGFFTTHADARTTLEQAAVDLTSHITSSLGAIAPSSMSFTGNNSGTTATVDWNLSFSNPTTGITTTLNNFSASAGEFRIFVGARSLSGATLGQGGSSGAGFSIGGSGFESDWSGAMAAMVTASNSVMNRTGGPTIGSFSGNVTLGATSPAYHLSYGLLAGTLWFDNDANNDGAADSDLSTYWHFNGATAVGAGLNDFYSVALHEMIHTLGLGGSETWNGEHSGATWLGTAGIAANGGSGTGLVDPTSLAHIASGTMSHSVVDNALQEALMDPSLTTGTRKYLTTLDLAFLQDIGFSTSLAAVPEPAAYALLTGWSVLTVVALRRRRA